MVKLKSEVQCCKSIFSTTQMQHRTGASLLDIPLSQPPLTSRIPCPTGQTLLSIMATVTETELMDIEELFLQTDPGAGADRVQPLAVTNQRAAQAAVEAAADSASDEDAADDAGVQAQVPGSQRLWIRCLGAQIMNEIGRNSPSAHLHEHAAWCARSKTENVRRFMQDLRLLAQHLGQRVHGRHADTGELLVGGLLVPHCASWLHNTCHDQRRAELSNLHCLKCNLSEVQRLYPQYGYTLLPDAADLLLVF